MALLVHGLNLEPSRMDAVGALLASRGVEGLRVALSGHRGDFAALQAASRERWLGELHEAFRVARARATALGVPLHLVANSLGATLGLDLAASAGDVRFDRCVLLSPALTPKVPAAPFLLLRALGAGPRSLPSVNLPAYRAQPRCPFAAYAALFDSVRAVEQALHRLPPTPTLVVIDRGDELVSFRRLARLAAARGWTLLEASTAQHRLPRRVRHLVVDEACVGPAEWARLAGAILAHLGV